MRNSKIVRVDSRWEKKAKEIMNLRLKKGLANFTSKEISLPEFTRLQMNAPSYPRVLEELKNLPKRR